MMTTILRREYEPLILYQVTLVDEDGHKITGLKLPDFDGAYDSAEKYMRISSQEQSPLEEKANS